MSNSPLVKYTKISPNKNSPRNHKIDTITIHCYVGQASVESMGAWFAQPSAECSCNYGIGTDGRIALIVDEKDRSWCSSSKPNDHRAITIECASDKTHPYAINDKVYKSLIALCADICKRNNIKELKWKADKSLVGQSDKQNMTVHRWFATHKECPGDYIYSRLGKIAAEVNAKLGVEIQNGDSTTDYEKKFWNFLKSKGLNDCAAAGVMGNIRAESAFIPTNLQDSFESKLGMTNESYTRGVDKGTYKNFVRDSAGYGLAQWTFWSRKQELLDFVKSKGVSIGDFNAQTEFFWKELQGYERVMTVLKNAKSVRDASNAMLFYYEAPGDVGPAQQDKRCNFSQEYYNKFATKTPAPAETTYTVQMGSFKEKANADALCKKVKAAGFDAIVKKVDGQYKVQGGVFKNKDNAEQLVKDLKKKSFEAIIK